MENKKVLAGLVFGLIIGGAVGQFSGSKSGDTKIAQLGKTKDAAVGKCSVGGGVNPDEEKVLTLGDKTFAYNELPGHLKHRIFDIQNDAYERSVKYYEEFALRALLAKEKNPNVAMENLPKMKDLIPEAEVSDKELKEFFDKNKNRLPPGTTLEKMRPQLTQHLKNQKLYKWFDDTLASYKSSGKIKILAKGPVSPEVELDLKGRPSLGNKDAKVTLVEASDYLCGHCQRVHPEVKEVIKKYGDKLKFVQANFSLRPEGDSGVYVRGAFCAQEQSEKLFWKYHNTTFERQGKAPTEEEEKLGASELATKVAKEVGLDVEKFKTCLNGEESKKAVLESNEKLSSVGVHGTPTFFINNKKLNVGSEGLVKAVEKALGIF
jgi:protein-disulfide isomerase